MTAAPIRIGAAGRMLLMSATLPAAGQAARGLSVPFTNIRYPERTFGQ